MVTAAEYDEFVRKHCNKTPMSVQAKTGMIHYNRFVEGEYGKKFLNNMVQGRSLGESVDAPTIDVGVYVPVVPAPEPDRQQSVADASPAPSIAMNSYAFETNSVTSSLGTAISPASAVEAMMTDFGENRTQIIALYERGAITVEQMRADLRALEEQAFQVVEVGVTEDLEPFAERTEFVPRPPADDPQEPASPRVARVGGMGDLQRTESQIQDDEFGLMRQFLADQQQA